MKVCCQLSQDGTVLAVFEGHDKEPPPPTMPPMPVIEALQPRMVIGSPSYGTRFEVIGQHILCGEAQVLVRFRGSYVETKVIICAWIGLVLFCCHT